MITHFNKCKSSYAALLLPFLLVNSVNAVVAKPGVQTLRQPDGSSISIILTGDAFNHRAYTTDGYLLITDKDGFYVFADCGADGYPVATSLKAVNPEKRLQRHIDEIKRIDQSAVADAFSLRHAAYLEGRNRAKNNTTRGNGLFSTHFPSTGEQKAIVILVEYADLNFTLDDPYDHYSRMLNEVGFSDDGATGSARDYFVENSGGLFSPTFEVYGPVRLSQPKKYYGQPDNDLIDAHPEEMVIEACRLLDDAIDFSEYDKNGDGVIDNVFVFYPGLGENDGGGAEAVWPHSNDITKILDREYFFDGMLLDHYACTNELKSTGIPDGIGTFCHEFSHVMGLPDLYATTYSASFTPGEYDIMDAGSYNNGSRTPPLYSSFERYALGYLEPEILSEEGEYELAPLTRENRAFILPAGKDNEYFLFENRQQEGSDLYIPGHGMLVWHIDFDQKIWDYNSVNNFADHQHVDLVEADNKKTKGSRDGDTFPGTKKVTSFNNVKKPYLRNWDNQPLPFDFSDIAESADGIITFSLSDAMTDIQDCVNPGQKIIITDGNKVSVSDGAATVHDLSGRKVTDLGKNPVTLDAGMYVVGYGTETRKIIVR